MKVGMLIFSERTSLTISAVINGERAQKQSLIASGNARIIRFTKMRVI